MQEYCKNCPHVNIEKSTKDLYNRCAQKTFDLGVCPNVVNGEIVSNIKEENIYCFVKTISIDWEDFENFLKENDGFNKNG
jgi:hypothetical protein